VHFPRRSKRQAQLTSSEQNLIAHRLAETILRTGAIEEVEALGLTFVFSGTLSQENQTVYTGVEFLGVKESYSETKYQIQNLKAEGVYGQDGNERHIIYDAKELRNTVNDILQSN
jgi:hypothetical protein